LMLERKKNWSKEKLFAKNLAYQNFEFLPLFQDINFLLLSP